MDTQHPLFDSHASHAMARPVAAASAPVWLQRMSLAILVIFCVYIGLILMALPWWPRLWDHNGWLLSHPALFRVLRTGWARGVVSGMGVLDVWIGVSEALHYRDQKR